MAGGFRARRVWLVPAAAAALLAGAAVLLGLVRWERHVGYFAPVWDADGRRVYLLERETSGWIWGLGWENFSPPANVYVQSDRLTLVRLDADSGEREELERFEGSPLQGRVTRSYRGRIFNHLSARLVPTADGVKLMAVLNVPRVPTSEQWSLRGSWRSDRPAGATWQNVRGGNTAAPEQVLHDDVELMAVRGREAFPAAVLAVDASGAARVLQQNEDFAALYPDGVPPELIAETSQRESIRRAQDYRYVEGKLAERFRAEGDSEGQALLRAHDEMEERGYIPKSPRLVATRVDAAPAGVEVFEIPADYFRFGLFRDIGEAIAAPGTEVKTDTGTYLRYDDDDLGPRLRAHREAGNDRFAARIGDHLFLLEVRRFEP